MSDGYRDPLSPDTDFGEDHNPYSAPQMSGDVTKSTDDLADLGARLGGAIVDGLVMIPAVVAVFAVVFSLYESGVIGLEDEVADELIGSLIGTVIGALWFLLVNGYLLATRGQSIGKLAAGTRIVDAETNELVPLGRLFFRRFAAIQLILAIPFIGNLIGLVDVLMIFRENRRCLHDVFANTKVINAHRKI